MKRICAIHQPNFLPRLSTLAKIASADVWVILDDVQFCRRDYQHRAKLAPLGSCDAWRWLTLPVHLPEGQRTEIRKVELVDPHVSAKRVGRVLTHELGGGSTWSELRPALEPILLRLAESKHVHEVAELSTRALLDIVGWQGEIVRSSDFEVTQERSARLADLTRAVRADTYLCGTGGRRYLDTSVFTQVGLTVEYFEGPRWLNPGVWRSGKGLSAVCALSEHRLQVPVSHCAPN
ncbi:WbqC family protein [Kribbella kalugense]|uniref:WbqC-like protein n=1 Tax=Kribbella kalugense TaxID=2512221 RepID=A0A4R7ZYU0_9ACTN|nr:WbqC family protein [Kribbella kalugense]TDW22118.1 WbqC-like protein [Kribbella kalugense]